MNINFIPFSDVKILPNRQRREHDQQKHQDLITSIKEVGLLSAPNLRPHEGGWALVAGERRIRAMTEIDELGGTFKYAGRDVPPGTFPFIPLSELSDIDAEAAELDENTKRCDLTWQEKAEATARLLDLRQRQMAVVVLAGGVSHPVTHVDVAEELYGTRMGPDRKLVHEEIILARNMDNPLVRHAKTRNEGMKALIRENTAKKHADLAAIIGPTLVSSSYQLHQSDCFTWMKTSPDAIFDVVCTDPPYGINADTFGNSADTEGRSHSGGAHFYTDDEALVRCFIKDLPSELFRLTKPNAHAYIFCDIEYFLEWRGAMEAAGWKVFRTPLIWFKPSAYRAPWPKQGPQRKYELILYAVKGDKFCTRLGGDVIECGTDANLGHHAQKPVALIRNLLNRSCVPGDVVFDPFCGTGSVFEAAKEVNAKAVGCELDANAYGIAASRIQRIGDIK